ncbi:MAG: hypothetical protein QW607_12615 [Desulfurococcaceae archaeon]
MSIKHLRYIHFKLLILKDLIYVVFGIRSAYGRIRKGYSERMLPVVGYIAYYW